MGRKRIVSYYNGKYKGILSDNTCQILDTLSEVEVVSDLTHCIYDLPSSAVELIKTTYESSGMYPLDLFKPIGTLTNLQTVGVAYMYWAGRLLLGDSVGLGKTVETAGLCNILKAEKEKEGKSFRYLLLTEKTLVEEIRNKMIEFTGDYVCTLGGEKKDSEKFIARYSDGLDCSVVGSHSLFNQPLFVSWMMSCDEFPFDLIIVDESSVLGNLSTQISKNAQVVLSKVDRRIFLNATPFESNLSIFYSQLSLLDDTLLPAKYVFEKEYFVYDYSGMYPKHRGKYKNGAEFRRLVGYRYFARTRAENGSEMIDCTADVLVSPLTPVQKKMMSKTQMWRMVCDCPNYFEPDIDFTMENVPKLASILDLLQGDFKDAESVIIFTLYTETQYSLSDWLNEIGWTNDILNGKITNIRDKNEIIRRFKNKEFKILITSVQKGLDFGDCNHCIFFSFDPNPQKMVQMEGRIVRKFDIINKHVRLLCSEGREYNFLDKVVRLRADAGSKFTKVDSSCIMSLLLGGGTGE